MTRVYSFSIYTLGSAVGALKQLQPGTKLGVAALVIWTAHTQLLGFCQETSAFPLDAAKRTAAILSTQLLRILRGPEQGDMTVGAAYEVDTNTVLHPVVLDSMNKSIAEFESALKLASEESSVWAVEDKGLYSTKQLIDQPGNALSNEARKYLWPNALADNEEAAKCLAFGRCTASGYHSLRALESAVKQYVLTAAGSLPPTNRQNWGEYISQLGNAGATVRVLGTLRIIKDSHRNPLMHPEDTLDTSQAIHLFQISMQSICELVQEMTNRGFSPAIHP